MNWQVTWLDELGKEDGRDIVALPEVPKPAHIVKAILGLMAEPEEPESVYGEYGEWYVDWRDGDSARFQLVLED